MTDETPTPNVPRAIVCPVEDCAVLIPDTIPDQRRHRRGHEHREKVDEGIRRALRTLSGRMDRLAGATKDDVAEMKRLVESIERLVQGIEIPEQQPQMEIARPSGWVTEDEPDEDEPDETEEDWAALVRPADPEPEAPTKSEPAADDAEDEDLPTGPAHEYPTGTPSAFAPATRGF